MAKKKSIVIIDGSNFYHKLKDLNLKNISSFDYSLFVETISKNTKIVAKYFCVGKIHAEQKNVRARKMMADQQSLVTRLQGQGFIIQFGFLLKSNDKFHEKGVDVQIATNLLKGAYKDIYDIAFLVTSDSDLIPSIIESQLEGKKVVYVGFKHKPSLALLRACAKSLLLTKDDLLLFTSAI